MGSLPSFLTIPPRSGSGRTAVSRYPSLSSEKEKTGAVVFQKKKHRTVGLGLWKQWVFSISSSGIECGIRTLHHHGVSVGVTFIICRMLPNRYHLLSGLIMIAIPLARNGPLGIFTFLIFNRFSGRTFFPLLSAAINTDRKKG